MPKRLQNTHQLWILLCQTFLNDDNASLSLVKVVVHYTPSETMASEGLYSLCVELIKHNVTQHYPMQQTTSVPFEVCYSPLSGWRRRWMSPPQYHCSAVATANVAGPVAVTIEPHVAQWTLMFCSLYCVMCDASFGLTVLEAHSQPHIEGNTVSAKSHGTYFL